jgi:solute carrier family 8 (sodium/calcium exchanger)
LIACSSFAYGFALIYLFLGISIVAEIFMEAIEKITSKTVILDVEDSEGNTRQRKVLFWNATVANLTLMALGSSAPEILLAVLETCTNLGQCPGELGASTIVGSAAFNLLVISGISVYAVSAESDADSEDRDESVEVGVKKIYDMRVFAITCTSSLWAYIWLWIVLLDQKVEVWEGYSPLFSSSFLSFLLMELTDSLPKRPPKKKVPLRKKTNQSLNTLLMKFTRTCSSSRRAVHPRIRTPSKRERK